ncbi:hypothetical protein NEHOM01_1495 [Nematocida homosporus]|uniref:uncharacterized protein n=1 Tax=Nematocida homosporus TaxID=1912981 RepID=UPI00221EB75F|nr:uncharacterized protein NEHOM01_1495 [Nematocida homosporus]KAI5186483.1 hypothetical protein NEHOM01_1495 [Nematocida homosporus]
MTKHGIFVARFIKISRISTFRYWLAGIWTLLALVSVARSNDITNMEVQDDWQTSDGIAKILSACGFKLEFGDYSRSFTTTPYIPERTQVPDERFGKVDSIPKYELEPWNDRIEFELPYFPSDKEAIAVLEDLRKIAIVRVSIALVSYKSTNPELHKISMQILSRVVNMLDCSILRFYYTPDLAKKARNQEVDGVLCSSEAQNTISHAKYRAKCHVSFSSASGLLDVINSKVRLLRPISSVTLLDSEFQHISYLGLLTLKPNYTLSIENLPNKANINLASLPTKVCKCQEISIKSPQNMKLTLTGFNHANNNFPILHLSLSWKTFEYLATHNPAQIQGSIVLSLSVSPDSHQDVLKGNYQPMSNGYQIAVELVYFSIDTSMPCDVFGQYRRIYTKEFLYRYGVVASNVLVYYEPGRNNFDKTIARLGFIGNLPQSLLKEIRESNIVCCGNGLNTIDWTLRQPVVIQLDDPQVLYWLKRHKQPSIDRFCQHIYYTSLNISGGQAPRKGQVKRCIRLLNHLESIRGQKLCISNIRDKRKTKGRFDLATLKAETTKSPRYTLGLDTLILDNVDEAIIYRMFGRYNIVKLNEVHILNQVFKNLAIVQLLSFSLGPIDTKLVLNDLANLNEIVRYNRRDRIKGFSLFKYVEDFQQRNQSVDSLHLNRLVLQVDDVDFGAHDLALSVIRSYGIELPITVAFKEYLANRSVIQDEKVVIIHSITTEALKADLLYYQAQNPMQAHLIKNTSITELVLHFSNDQVLTKESLIETIRWTICRFEKLAALRLRNANVTANMQNVFASHRYLILDLDSLKSIRIEGVGPNNSHIELLLQPHHKHLLANTTNTNHNFTAIASSTLFRLFHQLDQLDHLDKAFPKHIGSRICPLQIVIENLQKKKDCPSDIQCAYCQKPLCESTEEGPNKNGHILNEAVASKAFCYLKCGHLACHTCVYTTLTLDKPRTTCPMCRQTGVFENMHQLIGVPRSVFVFTETDASLLNADHEWLDTMALNDGHVYLYIPYENIDDLCNAVKNGPVFDEDHLIYVI